MRQYHGKSSATITGKDGMYEQEEINFKFGRCKESDEDPEYVFLDADAYPPLFYSTNDIKVSGKDFVISAMSKPRWLPKNHMQADP